MAQNANLLALMSMRKAFGVAVRNTNLAPVKQLKAQFDPFHPRVGSVRDFLFAMSTPRVKKTNMTCGMKVDVKSDRTPPSLEVVFVDGHRALFKTENLSKADIAIQFNKLCTVHGAQKTTERR